MTGDLHTAAAALGFDAVGVAPPDLPHERAHLEQWLAAGYAGSMEWLTRHPEVRLDLRERFPWARSVVVVGKSYPRPPARGLGRYVSVYARAADYHDLLLPKVRELADRLAPANWHAYVDTGPALERALGREAGLGWVGKHGLLMNPRQGSLFFLGLLVTDLDLPVTGDAGGSCGTCRACQPACPTDAFVQPGVLDARRCISYLTIEHRGPIDRALRPGMGAWLFGCDLCQTACPFNHGIEEPQTWLGESPLDDLDLPDLLALDDDAFRARFRRTPLWRPRREGLLRNALIVGGNLRREDVRPGALALLADPSPVLREAAGWCLGRMVAPEDRAELQAAHAREPESWVRDAMAEDLREWD